MILITQPRVGYAFSEVMALQFAARELNWEVESAPTSWRLGSDTTVQPGVPYGSQLFCEIISEQMGWELTGNSFDWLARIPSKYLRRSVSFHKVKEVVGLAERKFIKPADDKLFPALVYEVGSFDPSSCLDPKYAGDPTYRVPDDTPTLVSDVVDFRSEFRCFVKDQKVQTWSCYIRDGVINHESNWKNPDVFEGLEPPDAFLNRMLENVFSKPSVIDVGIIQGVGWAVIESNPAWASGIYGCDPVRALGVMASAVRCKHV